MMLSRWVSFGRLQVGLAIHLHPTPLDDPTSLFVLDNSDMKYNARARTLFGGAMQENCIVSEKAAVWSVLFLRSFP
jgi:hypothetical protein